MYVQNYKEIKKLPGFRTIKRYLTLEFLSTFNSLTSEKIIKKARIQFVFIHHTFKDEQTILENFLIELSNYFDFISYSEAVNKILNSEIDKPYLCISSDDGFKNNLDASTIFENFGIKACFFINPEIIGVTDYNKVVQYCKKKHNQKPIEFLNWNDIETLLKSGHEIGSHSMRHDNLALLKDDNLLSDLQESFDILKSKCGVVKHFAFPYGRFHQFNEFGRKAVFDIGYTSCASAENGCHINPNEKIPKENLLIRRNQLLFNLKFKHNLNYLIQNSKRAAFENNLYPY